jgi:cytochrome c oxidase subunit 2
VVLALGFGFLYDVRKADSSGSKGLQAAATRTAQKDLKLPAKPGRVLRIDATGQQWLWRYTYPGGTFSFHDLVVPEDTTVVLNIRSTDVVHTWWVPALGGKFDAVPGSVNHTWFRAEHTGVFQGRSATFSGPAYSAMRTSVKVVTADAYKAWVERQAGEIKSAQAWVAREVTRRATTPGTAGKSSPPSPSEGGGGNTGAGGGSSAGGGAPGATPSGSGSEGGPGGAGGAV